MKSSLWGFKDCYSRFHHTRWITHCMAFPCPAADSLAPMDHFLSFDVSLTIPKNIRKVIYASFSLITTYIRGYSLYSRVHQDVYIIQNLLECSLTWIQLIWLLAFHMPRDRTDSTFQYPFERYIRNPLVHWKHKRELRETKLYSIVSGTYAWVCIPLSLGALLCSSQSFLLLVSLLSEWWRIEVVEAQVGDLVSPVRRRAVKRLSLVIFDLY